MAMLIVGIVATCLAARRHKIPAAPILCTAVSALSLACLWMIKPGGRAANCIGRLTASGDRVSPMFWTRTGLLHSIVCGALLASARPSDPVSWVMATSIFLGACCKFWKMQGYMWVSLVGFVIACGFAVVRLFKDITWTQFAGTGFLVGQIAQSIEDRISLSGLDSIEMADLSGVEAQMTSPGDVHFTAEAAMRSMGLASCALGEGAVETGDVPSHEPCEIVGSLYTVAAQEIVLTAMMQVQVFNVLGGMDAKRLECPGVDGSRGQAQLFANYIQRRYRDKKGTLLEEMQQLLRTLDPSGASATASVPMSLAVMGEFSKELKLRFGETLPGICYGTQLFSMYLYTCQDVDIDRLCGFTDAPDFPLGKESPAERDEHYREYRAKVKNTEPRNPQMFQEANRGTRVAWDGHVESAEPLPMPTASGGDVHFKAAETLGNYVKWLCCICCQMQHFDPPLVTSRGLCGLPASLIDAMKAKQPGDFMFWAAMSSTTMDESISASYANQQQPVSQNVRFVIHNVYEGLELHKLSRYPLEQEFLLPACTVLRVRQIMLGPPLTVVVDYKGTMLTADFRQAVLEEISECEQLLHGPRQGTR